VDQRPLEIFPVVGGHEIVDEKCAEVGGDAFGIKFASDPFGVFQGLVAVGILTRQLEEHAPVEVIEQGRSSLRTLFSFFDLIGGGGELVFEDVAVQLTQSEGRGATDQQKERRKRRGKRPRMEGVGAPAPLEFAFRVDDGFLDFFWPIQTFSLVSRSIISSSTW
jgi:hypothetical protein